MITRAFLWASNLTFPKVAGRRTAMARELLTFGPYAQLSISARGRMRPEHPCTYRTDFVRDKDRIIYSPLFALLSGKTQVFSSESLELLAIKKAHDRVIHTAKVVEIARVICRALKLNEDLAEAIAWGHDLGHPPFGHEGEKILNILSMKYLKKPFRHNLQSLRIVRELNLCFEVMDGITRHNGEKKDPILTPYNQSQNDFTLDDEHMPTTLEGCVVRIADRIAYLPMDLGDGLRLNMINSSQIPVEVTKVLGPTPDKMIDTLVKNLIHCSKGRRYITMSPRVREAMDKLFDFNYKHIYFSKKNRDFVPTIEACINGLYKHFTEKEKLSPQEAIDKIVGLTDRQALALV